MNSITWEDKKDYQPSVILIRVADLDLHWIRIVGVPGSGSQQRIFFLLSCKNFLKAKQWILVRMSFSLLDPDTDPHKMGADPHKMDADPHKMDADPHKMDANPQPCSRYTI